MKGNVVAIKKNSRMDLNYHRDDNWSKLLEDVGKTQNSVAFKQLFEHFAPLIKGFCQSSATITLNSDSAEELVQEVFIKIWQNAHKFDASKASASTWIFTVTRNARIDYIRKHSRHQVGDNDLDADDIWDEKTDNQPFVNVQNSRDEVQLREQLKNLPPEQTECLIKVYMEGKSHSVISEELKLPLGTVKSRVRLGLKRLQSRLKSKYVNVIDA